MTQDILGGLAAFALVSSITPGPNNLMLMASGANFGLRRTVPHMLGIAIGFTIMIVLVGLGLARVFDAFPVSYLILKALSVAFLIWLAWKLANAAPPDPEAAEGRPLTFLQAALFQWVNPKAWAMALSAISIYAVSRTPEAILLVAAIFGIVNLPSIALWTVMGQQLRRLLSNPRRLRAFNIFMALMLLASLYPVLLSR